ncbi:MAG: methyltransferase [Ferroplasma sp.]|uniref:class I SAM-dependent methyltransferase n=1 Tax=Ferroplasma sp. TaxID=2591003 RepID=UPI002814CCF6|nr:methyltransferase [Ferroplasma sp.]WMT51340.1 MAG: methyltransferase [Ferroplasma sp.]
MIRPCLGVSKFNADSTIKKLREQHLLDSRYQIEQAGNTVYVPLIMEIENSKYYDFRTRKTGIDDIIGDISRYGVDTGKLSYIRLGNSLIFKQKISYKTARIFSRMPGIENIYYEAGKIMGARRKPSLRLVFGPGGDTTVVEYGIKYIMNLQKVMFSPGNINTRSKMRSIKLSGYTVIDMFCGIGYFSLQVMKNSRPKRMICCDINPDSTYYLKQNILANKIAYPVEVLTGDSRTTIPFISADYIIMGNFNSPYFISAALIRSHPGTEISMHYLATAENIEKRESSIMVVARKMGFLLMCQSRHNVKSVSPSYIHVNSIFTVVRAI